MTMPRFVFKLHGAKTRPLTPKDTPRTMHMNLISGFSLFAVMNAIFGSTSLLYGSCIQLSNRSDRTSRQPSCEHEVVNEMQFSDRQLHLTGRLSLSIRVD